MKKFLCAVLCTAYAFLTALTGIPHLPAAADAPPAAGAYACIVTDDVYFYALPDEKRGLFLLPATYYVKLVEYGEEYCCVEYSQEDANTRKLVGYVKTPALTFVPYTPNRPYLSYVFELRYRIDGAGAAEESFLNEIKIPCAYYGDYKIGSKTYCYVLRGEEFGYVPKPADLSYEPNDEYADYLAGISETPAPDANADTSKKKGASPVQIAILVVLCLLVPVLAALILKPPRRPPYDTDE